MTRAFVIGDPVKHSKSPQLHGYWLDTLGITGSYTAINVPDAGLDDFIQSGMTGKFTGGNATLPHKQRLLHLCDVVTETAANIGAVNTLYYNGSGQLVGDNTDKYGFLANLDQSCPGWAGKRRKATVLGAGGAARAIIDALQERQFEQIVILNRSVDRARSLACEFQRGGTELCAAGLADFDHVASDTGVLVNTSSVGMDGSRFEQLDLERLPSHAVVTDIVYTPIETPLLKEARNRGLMTVDGLGMLLHQAVPGFERWFGIRPDVTDALRSFISGEST